MTTYLHEFLYRGQPAGSPQVADYHIRLASPATDAFGKSRTDISTALTPAQATAQGFGLPVIIAAINAQMITDIAALKVQVSNLNAQLVKATGPSGPSGPTS